MTNLIANLAAITLYLICTLTLLMRLRQSARMLALGKVVALLPGFLALLPHGYIVVQDMITPIGVNFGFYNMLSLIAAVIALITLVSALRYPVEILGVVVMPLAVISMMLDMAEYSEHLLPPDTSFGLFFHVITSLIAYSVLALAAMHAITLWVQNNYLHSHQPGGLIRLLPPLKTMESLLFEAITIGFVFLTISLASGLMFVQNIFEQHLVHKTVLSILAWCVFAVLLIGRWFLGWRGRTAIRWTLGGFLSLMLAYFGSKFVLEVILGLNY